jgi:hypothetical protein
VCLAFDKPVGPPFDRITAVATKSEAHAANPVHRQPGSRRRRGSEQLAGGRTDGWRGRQRGGFCGIKVQRDRSSATRNYWSIPPLKCSFLATHDSHFKVRYPSYLSHPRLQRRKAMAFFALLFAFGTRQHQLPISLCPHHRVLQAGPPFGYQQIASELDRRAIERDGPILPLIPPKRV